MTSQDDASRRRARRHMLGFETMETRCLLSATHPVRDGIVPHHEHLLRRHPAQNNKHGPIRQGLALATSWDVKRVGFDYARLALSRDTLQVGASYVKAAVKGDGRALDDLGHSTQVKRVGQKFAGLSHSKFIKGIGQKFENFGKSVAGWFN